MIVCHCTGVSDNEIRRTVRDGACSVSAVAQACGAGSSCGGCYQSVEKIITETTSVSPASDENPLGLRPLATAGS
jgi:bacterioferritin-associated ferredoxin